jgi:plastocyanin
VRLRAIAAAGALSLAAGCGGGAGTGEAKKADSATPAYTVVDAASAATLTGKAVLEGRPPAKKPIRMGEEPECAKLHKGAVHEEDAVVGAGGALANVFVHVKSGLEGKSFAPPAEPVKIDQRACTFHPRVFGIRTGQTLLVSNSDPVSHNIHPMPKNNREWNQGQAPGAPVLERDFARAEIMIPVKCNVHSWMRSWIGVVEHPFFAVTGAEGTFRIGGLPPGEYELEAWHERFGARSAKVTLAAGATAAADFRFTGR